jgi:hypothetical protein
MASTLVTSASLTDDVVTLVVDSVSGFRAFYPVTVVGVSEDLDGTGIIISAVDPDLSTITYPLELANVSSFDCLGQIALEVSWIDDGDVADFLGFEPAGTDAVWLAHCTAAANLWCWRKRAQSNYTDLPTLVPSADVKAGTILRAAMTFRERGSIDSFQVFESSGAGATPVGSIGQILQLLGCGKPAFG